MTTQDDKMPDEAVFDWDCGPNLCTQVIEVNGIRYIRADLVQELVEALELASSWLATEAPISIEDKIAAVLTQNIKVKHDPK